MCARAHTHTTHKYINTILHTYSQMSVAIKCVFTVDFLAHTHTQVIYKTHSSFTYAHTKIDVKQTHTFTHKHTRSHTNTQTLKRN